eukprot:EC725533.1.p1 GENE.EC725533.1~~EC725533.1.p1  ORF type:complete len:82 (+),score=6.68 EC725533.1:29-247(+)
MSEIKRTTSESEIPDDVEDYEEAEGVRPSAFLLTIGAGIRDNVLKPFLWGAAAAIGMGVGYKIFDRYISHRT